MNIPKSEFAKSANGHRVNDAIEAEKILLIGATGEKEGVVSRDEALRLAEEKGLDLVEVSASANPPVCKLLDYGKYKYQEQKKANEARKRQRVITVKEIKMRPNIDIHDYQFKMRAMRRFLEDGDKVKVSLRFRGREMAHPHLGEQLLQRVCNEVEELARVEIEPKMEGWQMSMVLAPKGP